MNTSVRDICRFLEQGRAVASAVIVRQDGSAPRGPGARLVADNSGLLSGTVGGGLAEARVLDWCREALATGKPLVRGVDMDGKLAAGADMICGGRVIVLVEPLGPDDLPLYRQLLNSITPSSGKAGGLFAVRLSAGSTPSRVFIPAVGAEWPSFLPKLEELPDHGVIRPLVHGTESQTSTTTEDWYLEPVLPAWQLILAGGGHVSRPTAHMASLLGFDVIVLDDREEFATPERFPDALQTHTVPEFTDCFAACPPNAHTCVVILTRGHVHDASVLEQTLRSSAGYIGMIGSVRKRDQVYASLQEKGFSAQALAMVHCPVGIKINAQTPEEIAISILAELVDFRGNARG